MKEPPPEAKQMHNSLTRFQRQQFCNMHKNGEPMKPPPPDHTAATWPSSSHDRKKVRQRKQWRWHSLQKTKDQAGRVFIHTRTPSVASCMHPYTIVIYILLYARENHSLVYLLQSCPAWQDYSSSRRGEWNKAGSMCWRNGQYIHSHTKKIHCTGEAAERSLENSKNSEQSDTKRRLEGYLGGKT